MKIGERVACIETEIKTIKRLMYVILLGLGFEVSSSYLPVVTANLG